MKYLNISIAENRIHLNLIFAKMSLLELEIQQVINRFKQKIESKDK